MERPEDLDHLLGWGGNRDAPMIYLLKSPDPRRAYCASCSTGMLTLEADPHGKGDLYTCTGGCGQRYWIDLD